MKKIINIFLWLSIIFHGVHTFIILVLSWGPIYLVIVKGQKYDLLSLMGVFLALLIGFIISIIIYRNFRDHSLVLNQNNIIFLITFLIVCFGLSTLFSLDIVWISRFFICGLVILLVFYPKIVKKYY